MSVSVCCRGCVYGCLCVCVCGVESWEGDSERTERIKGEIEELETHIMGKILRAVTLHTCKHACVCICKGMCVLDSLWAIKLR